ncbi:MAG TPA: (d)CMP kinase [Planctomycetaceae bacterium]|nr:(d)CMP kinase [Planctomycetaceae bacterium]
MIVTIDGPAGAGKSSVAKKLASQLSFFFLDTGAMYRSVALAGLRRDWDFHDQATVGRSTQALKYQYQDAIVLLDGGDVSQEIRDPEVSRNIHHVADNPFVRDILVQWQRQWAVGKDLVTEGRDQGTVVFPNAECKIFLTATDAERARRRWLELKDAGQAFQLEQVLHDQTERDRRDRERKVGALRQASDAVEIISDGMSCEEVVAQLTQMVNAVRQSPAADGSKQRSGFDEQ